METKLFIWFFQDLRKKIYFKEDEKKSSEALLVLEEIDDDLDEVGIMFVKLDDEVRKLTIELISYR